MNGVRSGATATASAVFTDPSTDPDVLRAEVKQLQTERSDVMRSLSRLLADVAELQLLPANTTTTTTATATSTPAPASTPATPTPASATPSASDDKENMTAAVAPPKDGAKKVPLAVRHPNTPTVAAAESDVHKKHVAKPGGAVHEAVSMVQLLVKQLQSTAVSPLLPFCSSLHLV